MIRKLHRERKSFLHEREQAERSNVARLRSLQKHVQTGQKLPRELRDPALQRDYRYDEALLEQGRDGGGGGGAAADATVVDDEYWDLGTREPRVLLTTSRDPSSRLTQFAKEMKLVIPNARRINRGNHVIRDLVRAGQASGISDLVIVHEHRGRPDGLVVSHLPHGPTAYFSLHNVVLRHDIATGKAPTAYPHVILHSLDRTAVARRAATVLRALFPPPAAHSRAARTVAFVQAEPDAISFRHHIYVQDPVSKGPRGVRLAEIGPRFELRLYEIRRGTADDEAAPTEWALRLYQRHKQGALG